MKDTVALVEMGDNTKNFFIRNPPNSPIEKWIGRFVDDVSDVEFVEVYRTYQADIKYRSWSNPNCCPES
jgi:hypothetical protein